jgi:transposase
MTQNRLSEATRKRLRAGRLLLSGRSCAEVAAAVGVARQTVYTWKRILNEGGMDALRDVAERGRPAALDARQLESVRTAVLRGPSEHGFGAERWTRRRVGIVIERLHGVRYGRTQVFRIMRALGLQF